MSGRVYKLRRLLTPLRRTPLHPQWLIYRNDSKQTAWAASRAGGRVLDIGCADGAIREALPKSCEYIGLDYPATAIELYQTKPQVFADGAKLPFENDAFDTVFLLEVLEHVRDDKCVIAEIARVLRPGGRLLFSVPFLYPLHDAPHDYRRLTAPGIRMVLENAGFQVNEIASRNVGIEAVMLLAAIGFADAAASARGWRLAMVPFWLLGMLMANMFGGLSLLAGSSRGDSGGQLFACGHAVDAQLKA